MQGLQQALQLTMGVGIKNAPLDRQKQSQNQRRVQQVQRRVVQKKHHPINLRSPNAGSR
jgi:hypothetical protein